MTLKEFLHKPFMKRIIRLVCLTFAGVIVAHLILKQDRIYWQDMTFHSMSTYVTYRVYLHNTESSAPVFRIVNEAFREINQRCNRFDPESEIARLNAAAYQKPFSCSPELWELLCKAREMYQLSGGAFDISVGPLTKIWKNCQMKTLPTESEIAAARAKVGLDKVIFDDAARTVRFTVGGMSLDLGGIAKGFALDRARERLRQEGVSGILDLGGNLAFLPGKPAGKERVYRVAVKDPGNPRRLAGGVLEVAPGMAVSTSGDYERRVEYNGKRYGHIIDPVSGEPASPECSATVISPSAMRADWLSTAVFLRGTVLAEKAEKELKNCRVWMVKK